MQTHLGPKIMHHNLAVILRQFNFSKNSFIVLVLTYSLHRQSHQTKVELIGNMQTSLHLDTNVTLMELQHLLRAVHQSSYVLKGGWVPATRTVTKRVLARIFTDHLIKNLPTTLSLNRQLKNSIQISRLIILTWKQKSISSYVVYFHLVPHWLSNFVTKVSTGKIRTMLVPACTS